MTTEISDMYGSEKVKAVQDRPLYVCSGLVVPLLVQSLQSAWYFPGTDLSRFSYIVERLSSLPVVEGTVHNHI